MGVNDKAAGGGYPDYDRVADAGVIGAHAAAAGHFPIAPKPGLQCFRPSYNQGWATLALMKLIRTVYPLLPLVAGIWMVGCATPNPVEGWTCHDANLDPPNQPLGAGYEPSGWIYHIDQTIIDDSQAYIQNVKSKHRDLNVDEVDFYEDGTGRHAVRFTVETDLEEYAEYYLMYDQNNVRTKVIKTGTLHQFHM